MDRRQQVRRWLDLREREGLTYAQLSARSGIPANTLAHWAWRLRKEARRRSDGVEFVELIPARGSADAPASRIVIELGNGRRIVVDASVAPEALARLAAALERC
jgi:hypothetical protein